MSEWMMVAEEMESSYRQNGLGWVIWSLVKMYKPYKVVEIGVLDGYSGLFAMAALRDNCRGCWVGFDLFDDYEYKHRSLEYALANIQKAKLDRYGMLIKRDAEQVPLDYRNSGNKIDLCHIDISNDGTTFLWALDEFQDIIRVGGLLVMEGGSPERDNTWWMKKYNKIPINPVIYDCIQGYRPDWRWRVIAEIPLFPSMTIFERTV